ncbi:hypothetical protein [Thermotalea metallivorans]|uniref:Uncharacterized protein n=1 Tax=Thermotalea metallivorans TaxID=520762 RepID=A0A140L9Z5_9FIRM|nr:hypothetical protein [Thermotalea metallivorans]KXG77370.1 hypothetical protein AN619_04960 [Thermotalea metallivorans]
MITKKFVSLVMILNIIAGLLITPYSAFAAENTGVHKIYRLDTGVIFIWSNSSGIWQRGYGPGSSYSSGFSLDLTTNDQFGKSNIKNVKVYPYTTEFYRQTGITPIFNVTAKAKNMQEYTDNYMPHASQNISITKAEYNPSTGKVEVNYNALLNSDLLYDVKEKVAFEKEQYIYDYMGGKDAVPANVIASLEAMKGNLFSPKVQGFMYFVPIIIEYEVQQQPQESIPAPVPAPGVPQQPTPQGNPDIQTNLKIKLTKIAENASAGQAVEVRGYVELEGQSSIASDIALIVDGKEVQRLRDVAIAGKREFKLVFEMPNKAVNVYAAVNPDKTKPNLERTWADNVSDLMAVFLNTSEKNPGEKITVDIIAPKSMQPKEPYNPWNFQVTVSWSLWRYEIEEETYIDANGVERTRRRTIKVPVTKTVAMNIKASGQYVTMYYPNTGEQIIKNATKEYPGQSLTVSGDGEKTFSYSVPGGWFIVDTKTEYGFGPAGYNAILNATLSNGAKDTATVLVKGISPLKAGVKLSQ